MKKMLVSLLLCMIVFSVFSAAPSLAEELQKDTVNATSGSATAVAYVFVNVTEPPPQSQMFGLTGLAGFEPFDFSGFFSGIAAFFSGLFA